MYRLVRQDVMDWELWIDDDGILLVRNGKEKWLNEIKMSPLHSLEGSSKFDEFEKERNNILEEIRKKNEADYDSWTQQYRDHYDEDEGLK